VNRIFVMENLENEIWKPISGYEDIYEISNWGRVKSLSRDIVYETGHSQRMHEKVLKLQKHTHDYKSIGLHDNKVQATFLVHRIVGEHFVDNPYNYQWINHKDGDKSNNYYKNLEWCTPSDNSKHAFKIGLRTNKKRSDSHFAKKAIHVETGVVYHCIKDAYDAYGKFNYGYFIAMLKGSRPNKTGFKYYISEQSSMI
jgi:hypothetical protein